MHAQAQRTLKRLVKQYGPDLIEDPRRTEALLNDLCGQHRREIFVLVNAQRQRIPAELLAAPSWMPYPAISSRLSRQLQAKLALTEDAADWAVATWAAALELGPTQKKSGWFWQRRTDGSPPSSTTPAQTGKAKPRKRQTTQHGVKYQSEPGQKPKRRPAGRERAHSGVLRIPDWAQPIRKTVVGLAVVALVIALSVSVLRVFMADLGGRENLSSPAVVAEPEVARLDTGEPEPGPVWEPVPAQTAAAHLTDAFALPRIAWVTEGPLLVRQGPSTGDAYLATLEVRSGVTVDGFSEDGRWSRIQDPNSGWVNNDYLAFLSDDTAKAMVHLDVRQVQTETPVPVRALPNATAAEVGVVDAGASVTMVARTTDGAWHQVVHPLDGWIAAEELPVAVDP